jgi:hypothetical protein
MTREMAGKDIIVGEIPSSFGGDNVEVVVPVFPDLELAVARFAREYCVPGDGIIQKDPKLSKDPIKAARNVQIENYHVSDQTFPEETLLIAAAKVETAEKNLDLSPKQKEHYRGVKENFIGAWGFYSGPAEGIDSFHKSEPLFNGKFVKNAATGLLVLQMAASCNRLPPTINPTDVIPSITPIVETATATETLIPTPTPEPTATPTPEGPLGQLSSVAPGVGHDATGYHITFTDSGRIVDIAEANVENQLVFDEEFNLYKIFDAEGNITAEYDPGQGKDGDTDYVSATGWVDMKKLADSMDCGALCMKEYSNAHVQNSVYFEFKSTGVFRYIDVKDEKTNEIQGKLLVLQITSLDKNIKPTSAWFLVQAEKTSEPGVNKIRAVAQRHFGEIGKPLNEDGGKLFSVEDWKSWSPKGHLVTYSFMDIGVSYIGSLTGWQPKTVNQDAAKFIGSHGVDFSNNPILVLNGW